MPEESKSPQKEREELPRTFKPSDRRRTVSRPGALNQLPVMNLMIILIPVLLAQSAAIKLTLHEVDLIGEGERGPVPEEKTEHLSLTVSITEEGFDIISAFGREETTGVMVPMKEGKYDYEALHAKLMEIKKQIKESGINFMDARNVRIMSEPGIQYDIVIQVMDAAKWGEDEEGNRISLFPGISLLPGKLQAR